MWLIPLVMFTRDSDSNHDSFDLSWDRVVFICSEPSIMKFANQLYLTAILQFSLYVLCCFMDSTAVSWLLVQVLKHCTPHVLGKYIWNSHDPNTDHELNTRAFARPFAHIPFISVGRTKECQECAHILLQVGPTRFMKVPLTTDIKISLWARFCSLAINTNPVLFVFHFSTSKIFAQSSVLCDLHFLSFH